MSSRSRPPSATSLPESPRDDASARSRRYLLMMGIRLACFLLMVVITPYGWYTWVFGVGAIFLPYVAVVTANVAADRRASRVTSPRRALSAATPAYPPAVDASTVIRISEHSVNPPREE